MSVKMHVENFIHYIWTELNQDTEHPKALFYGSLVDLGKYVQ